MINKQKEKPEVVHEAEPINALSTIKASALIDVSAWKKKQQKLVSENKFFKITDNKTYEAAKKCRTNVVKGRTELVNQDKLVASKFATIRKEVGTETETLIQITKPLEDKWQDEVKAWEDRKEREKEEADKAEALRVKTITDKIEAFETDSYTIIQKMTYDEIISKSAELSALDDAEFDYEEYDILYDQVKDRITAALEAKVKTLTDNENQRLRNLELEKENAEAKAKADLQAARLTEIMPYVAFGVAIDLTKLSEMKDDEYAGHLSSKKGLFEADAKLKADAETERLAKEDQEKEAVYEIRAKRLEEAGMIYSDEHNSFWTKLDPEFIILEHDVYNEGTLEFEDTLVEVKAVIKREQRKIDLFAEREKALTDVGMLVEDYGVNFKVVENEYFTVSKHEITESNSDQFSAILIQAKESFIKRRISFVTALGYVHNTKTRNFELKGFDSYSDDFIDYKFEFFHEKIEDIKLHIEKRNEELSIADAEKLKLENEARINKYAGDKKSAIEYLESFTFTNPVPEFQNEDFNNHFNWVLKQLEDYAKAQTEKFTTF